MTQIDFREIWVKLSCQSKISVKHELHYHAIARYFCEAWVKLSHYHKISSIIVLYPVYCVLFAESARWLGHAGAYIQYSLWGVQ